jgi:hypothetical protein
MQNITSRIELFFLDTFILLLSESPLMRSLIARTGKFCREYKEAIRVSAALFICGIAGLVAGQLLIRIGLIMPLH